MKKLTATILTGLASLGGVFGYFDHKLGGLEDDHAALQVEYDKKVSELNVAKTERDSAETSKHEILKDYIAAQVRLKEAPPIDLTFANPTEVQQAYIDLAEEKGIELEINDDAFQRLREKALLDNSTCIVK